MRIFTYILSVIAAGFIIYNLTKVNYNNPLEGDSKTAVITIIAGLCAIMMLAIIRISRKVESTLKQKRKTTEPKQ